MAEQRTKSPSDDYNARLEHVDDTLITAACLLGWDGKHIEATKEDDSIHYDEAATAAFYINNYSLSPPREHAALTIIKRLDDNNHIIINEPIDGVEVNEIYGCLLNWKTLNRHPDNTGYDIDEWTTRLADMNITGVVMDGKQVMKFEIVMK